MKMKTLRKPIHDRPHGWLVASLFLGLCGPLWAVDLDLELIGSWPFFPRGPAQAVAVSGSNAYVAAGGLMVLDISDPASPQLVGGQWGSPSANAYAVAVSGNYAYLTESCLDSGFRYGLQVIDISNPANPRRVGAWTCDGQWGVDLAVSGNYVYVAASDAGLQVIGVSNPANPQQVGALTNICPTAVKVSGNCAYLTGRWSEGTNRLYGLQVIDISTPTNPQRVGSLEGASGQLAVSGNYADVAGSWVEGTNHVYGLQVIDVSDPANPQRVGSLVGGFGPLAVSGHYTYDGAGGAVIDISNPANPQVVGRLGVPGDVAVSGHYAYVAANDAGLQVIDISNPALPQRAGTYDTTSGGSSTEGHHDPWGGLARDVAVSGHRAYVADGCHGLQVIDMSNPANPKRIGGCDTRGQAEAVALSGDYGYVADGDEGLQVIDISNPANPRRVGGCDTSGYAEGVAVSGNYAYVADGWRSDDSSHSGGLRVINVSDPANPRQVGTLDTSGYAQDVVVSGNYAYLAESLEWTDFNSGSLRVIDVSVPANPQQVAAVEDFSNALAVAVSGNYAYIGARWAGLQVIDISSPTRPRRVATYNTRCEAMDVAVWGHYAYAVSIPHSVFFARGLEVIDVSDPANPQPVAASGSMPSSTVAVAVTVSSDRAYWLTSDYSGRALLQVIDIKRANPQRVGEYDIGGNAQGVAVSGHYAYVTGDWMEDMDLMTGLQVIDIANPAFPQVVGGCDTGGNPCDVAVSGQYAYVVDYDAGLQVIDISNPASPRRVRMIGDARRVAVSGCYAYVMAAPSWDGTNTHTDLRVIDISNPASPRQVGLHVDIGVASAVAVLGDYAYVTGFSVESDGWKDGLHVIDISSPVNPHRVGECEIGSGIADRCLAVSNNYAYVGGSYWLTAGWEAVRGFEIIDISDPTNPRPVGGCDAGALAWDIEVSGKYAYVLSDGLQVFDISDPANAKRVGGNSSVWGALAVSGDKVYVAAGEDGLVHRFVERGTYA